MPEFFYWLIEGIPVTLTWFGILASLYFGFWVFDIIWNADKDDEG